MLIGICCLINVRDLDWNTWSEIIQSVLVLFFCAVLGIMPLWISIFYGLRIGQFENEQFRRKYGVVIDGLHTKRLKGEALIFPVAGLIRRGIFIAILVFMVTLPTF